MLRRIFPALAVGAAFATFMVEGCRKDADTDEFVHIAVVSSETGDLAEIGKDMAHGAIMAIEEVNAAGGLEGRQIKYHTPF